MTIIDHPELEQLLKAPEMAEYAETLAEIPPGFYSNPELGHRVAGSDIVRRKTFYNLVNVLVDCGELATLTAWHNNGPLRIIEIEENHLRELFAGIK